MKKGARQPLRDSFRLKPVRDKNCRSPYLHPRSVNLYRFVRFILGPDTRDRDISSRWGIDPKNFSEFKNGKTPVPRLEKLTGLAHLLGINKHLVFQVACGASADKVFKLIKKNNLPGQIKLLGFYK